MKPILASSHLSSELAGNLCGTGIIEHVPARTAKKLNCFRETQYVEITGCLGLSCQFARDVITEAGTKNRNARLPVFYALDICFAWMNLGCSGTGTSLQNIKAFF